MKGPTRRVQRLQQSMVRMMVDSVFRDAVYRDQVPELSAEDRALLIAPDPRAWSTDRYRRGRLTRALLDEYPVTGAVVGVSRVDAFFGSDAFAAVLASRGSISLAFADWAAPQAGDVALLEGAMCRARRWVPARGKGIQAGPGVVVVDLGAGTLDFLQHGMERLGAQSLDALAQGLRLSRPTVQSAREHVIITCTADGQVGASLVGEAIAALTRRAARPLSTGALLAAARRLGATPSEAAALIQDLLNDGVLAESPPPWPSALDRALA